MKETIVKQSKNAETLGALYIYIYIYISILYATSGIRLLDHTIPIQGCNSSTRQREHLAKICFINHAKKYIKEEEIGYVDRVKSYV